MIQFDISNSVDYDCDFTHIEYGGTFLQVSKNSISF